jgi:hypothetical protein
MALASPLYLLDRGLVVLAGPVLGHRIDVDGGDYPTMVRDIARRRASLQDVPDERIVASTFGLDATPRGAAAIPLVELVDQGAVPGMRP